MYPLNYLWRFLARNLPNDKLRHRALLFAIKYSRGTFFWRDNYGNLLLLEMGSFVDGFVFVKGSSEPRCIAAMQDLIKRHKCAHFIDVGTNMGYYSLTMAAMPEIEAVHSFEPDPRNYAQFMANLFINKRFAKIKAHNMALGDTDGEIAFYPSRFTLRGDARVMNAGTSSVNFDPNRHNPDDKVMVDVRCADSVLPLSKSRLAIKIDVEGFEGSVLRGMERLLTENQCVILVEILGDPATTSDYLKSLGYSSIQLELETDNYCFSNFSAE